MKKSIQVFALLYIFALIPQVSIGVATAPAQEEITLRVARLSYFDGPVSIQRTKDEDWIDAMINTPLMAGDKVYAGIGGRAEIQLEDGVVVRLGEDSFIDILTLDDKLGQIQVVKGTVAVHAPDVDYDRPPLEIKSLYFSATVLDPVNVRFNVQENGPAEIPVHRGMVRIYRDEESHFRIKRGEKLIVEHPDPDTYVTLPADPPDDFDRWCDLRDAMLSTSVSERYVSNRVSGYQDLDRYGEWTKVPNYGRVWRPTVVVDDWAPYRHGRWVYVEPYRWTWVSYEPWGWVPYHYGRWVHVDRYDWCWVPTDVVHVVHRRPVWYPALVSFTYASHGDYFSFSIGGGYYDGPCVGWFPLGPADPFYPWYHRRSVYVHPVTHAPLYDFSETTVVNNTTVNNITNITNINNYQNSDAPHAVTVMPRRDFEQGQHERRAAASLTSANPDNVVTGQEAVSQLPARRPKRSVDRKQEINVPSGASTIADANGTKQTNSVTTEAKRNTLANRSDAKSKPRKSAMASSAVQREDKRVRSTKSRRGDAPIAAKSTTEPKRSGLSAKTKAPRKANTLSPAKVDTGKTSEPRRGKTSYNSSRPSTSAKRSISDISRKNSRSSPLESRSGRSTSPKRSAQYNSKSRTPSVERRNISSPKRETRNTSESRSRYSYPKKSYRTKSNTVVTPNKRSYNLPSAKRKSGYSAPRNYNSRSSVSSQNKSKSYEPRRNTTITLPKRSSKSSNYERSRDYSTPRTYNPRTSSKKYNYSVPRSSSQRSSLSKQRSSVPRQSTSRSHTYRSPSRSNNSKSIGPNTSSRSYSRPSTRSPRRSYSSGLSSKRSYSSKISPRRSSRSSFSQKKSFSSPSRSDSPKRSSRSSSFSPSRKSYNSRSPKMSSSGRSYNFSASRRSSSSSFSAPRSSSSLKGSRSSGSRYSPRRK